ncbi:MAG: hypothetical protein WD208_08045 [Dehalococcoidia bacterium]
MTTKHRKSKVTRLRLRRHANGPSLTQVLVMGDSARFVEDMSARLRHNSRMHILGGAITRGEAVERTVLLRPDVAVVDIDMGYDFGGIDTAHAIRKALPTTAIVMISPHTDRRSLAMFPRSCGLKWSYLLPETVSQGDCLADAVHSASWSIPYIDPKVDREALGAFDTAVDKALVEVLNVPKSKPVKGGQVQAWHGVVRSFAIDRPQRSWDALGDTPHHAIVSRTKGEGS